MRKVWALGALFASACISFGVGTASADTVGAGSNAGTITITGSGTSLSVSVTAPAGTYDGSDDVVYNVLNQSSANVTSMVLTGTGISGFDRDGILNYVNSAGQNVFGGYGGVHDYLGAYNATPTGGPTDTSFTEGSSTSINIGTDYVGYDGSAAGGYFLNQYVSFTPDPSMNNSADGVLVKFGGSNGLAALTGTGFISFERDTTLHGSGVTGASIPTPVPNSAAMGLALLAAIGGIQLFRRRTAC